MKNKNLKKIIIIIAIISLITLSSIIFINYHNFKKYEYNNDLIISNIITNIKEAYPEVDESEIAASLNAKELKDDENLKHYGIYFEDSYLLANKEIRRDTLILNFIIIITYSILLIIVIIIYNRNNNQKIKEITNYLKEINNHNYNLDINKNDEDELSILKNELYKTAIMLNENSLISKKEKESLKDSLSDISHQLKTPLTSINLMIDNLDNQNISPKQKQELITSVKRKINSLNFLVQSLLKLSKFDANTITFTKKKVEINKILNEVKDNLSALCDLKDITININGKATDILNCDSKWQVEALTNIVKNCLEYSPQSSNIDIFHETNDIFTKITITDYGVGMSKKDQKHLFERFYKGENSSSDSVGIGLSLAKTIIEKDNGNIIVTSSPNKGTTFVIKYLK